jgi:hypothetical protein
VNIAAVEKSNSSLGVMPFIMGEALAPTPEQKGLWNFW